MATKLYPQTFNASFIDNLLLATSGVASNSKATATVAGPTSGVQVQNIISQAVSFISKSLDAVTISGTITFNIWGFESAMAANTGFDVLVERCDSAGAVLSTIVRSEFGTELGTANAVNNWTAAPTSTTLSQGDKIKVTVFGNDVGTMASGNTFTMTCGGLTPGAAYDSWIQFTETITEGSAAVAIPNKIYMTRQAVNRSNVF